MPRPRRTRDIPLRFDDGFRGAIAMLVSVPFVVVALLMLRGPKDDLGTALAWLCVSFTVFFVVYIAWTHLLLSREDARTRAGLTAVRVQTVVAFAFNTIVVAMAVSLITGLVTSS